MRPRTFALVALLLAAPLLTGCIGQGGEDVEAASDVSSANLPGDDLPAATTEDGRNLVTDLTAEDTISAPSWEVGQWFGYHVFFGMEDDEGIHYNAVVTEEEGSSWFLATDNQDAAKYEAMFDLQLLGTFAKDDLATTLNGDPYTWYSFPLSNGTTWEASFDLGNLVGGQPQVVDLTFEATYNPSIPTKDGEFPGFDVVGYTAEGNLTMEYDYVPAIGWFGHLFIYNPHSDGDDWVLHLMTMGSGTNWTGTYYVDEARPLFEANTDTFVNPEDPGANQVGAPIMGSATVSEEATYVTGFLYSYAFAGASDTSVVDPDHERHGFTSVGAPFSFAFAFVDVDAKPGDWYLESTGAGVAAGGGAFLYEIVETTGTL